MLDNPRYLVYCEANGNTPEQQHEIDGGSLTAYAEWIRSKWEEFGFPRRDIVSNFYQEEFDKFLKVKNVPNACTLR